MRSLAVFFILFSNLIFSQVDLINAKKPIDAENKSINEITPLEYTNIDENDILWSRVVYEFIDLNEKLNFPLLFPTNDEQNKIGRKSIWRVLKEHIVNKIEEDPSGTNLEIYKFDEFSSSDKLSTTEIKDLMSYEFFSRKTGGNQTIYVKSNEIGGYNIKGIWYFDKKASELKYRLLGIQPVGANTEDL